MVDKLFVPWAQQTSVLNCRLSDIIIWAGLDWLDMICLYFIQVHILNVSLFFLKIQFCIFSNVNDALCTAFSLHNLLTMTLHLAFSVRKPMDRKKKLRKKAFSFFLHLSIQSPHFDIDIRTA